MEDVEERDVARENREGLLHIVQAELDILILLRGDFAAVANFACIHIQTEDRLPAGAFSKIKPQQPNAATDIQDRVIRRPEQFIRGRIDLVVPQFAPHIMPEPALPELRGHTRTRTFVVRRVSYRRVSICFELSHCQTDPWAISSPIIRSEISFDEMFSAPGVARPHYSKLFERFKEMERGEFERKRALAASTFLSQGVTFTVYNDDQGTERIFPFDLLPRIIPAEEWDLVERGLVQRITALNLFLHDIYHGQNILKDGVIPKEIVWEAAHFRPEFMHFDVPRNIYIHICGTDLIRDKEGTISGSGRQRTLPFRRFLRHRKPPDDEADLSQPARPVSRAPRGGLQPGIAQCASLHRAARPARADRRAPHSGRL